MKRLVTLAVLWSLQAFAGDWEQKAFEAARKLSVEGKYTEAAAHLTEVAKKGPTYFTDAELASLKKGAEQYLQRQAWVDAMQNDPKAARSLLKSVLAERGYPLETTMNVDDPRVQAALAALRAKDRKAAQFFSKLRTVKVEVTGAALEPVEKAQLADRVALVLRSFGFEASSSEGLETFTLSLELEPGVSAAGLLGQPADTKMVGAGFKVPVNWSSPNRSMLLDLSLRGIGYSDIPRSFEKANWPRIPDLLGPRLFVRFDEANPL